MLSLEPGAVLYRGSFVPVSSIDMSFSDKPLTEAEKETCAVYVMRMALEDYSVQTGRPYEDAMFDFVRSTTYQALFDMGTELRREGPDYIRSLFEKELAR